MILQELQTIEACRSEADAAWELMERLYPICRSITGAGVRQTLDAVGEQIPLQRTEVPSGTPVFDWEVPNEWNVREAWVEDPDGRRVVDLKNHSLHLMSYSTPIRATLPLAELRPHLHSLPEHPDWIPYRTSYYHRDWGFCLPHRDLEALPPGDYVLQIATHTSEAKTKKKGAAVQSVDFEVR